MGQKRINKAHYTDDVFSEQSRFDFILGYKMTSYFKNVDIPAGMPRIIFALLPIDCSARSKSNEFRPRVANI